MTSKASHRPQRGRPTSHPQQAPLGLWHWPQSVGNTLRPFHPAEGKMLPVGATRKHLEYLAFGGLGAGAGLLGTAETLV